MCMCSFAASQVLASVDPKKTVVKTFQYVLGAGVRVIEIQPAPSESPGSWDRPQSALTLASKESVPSLAEIGEQTRTPRAHGP